MAIKRNFDAGVLFPSPQGGSETVRDICADLTAYVSIPSRRVGDMRIASMKFKFRSVSIPSRRVGDPPPAKPR